MKIKTIILTLTLIASTIAVNADVPPEVPSKSLKAPINLDLNHDGITDIKDVRALAKAVVAQTLTQEEKNCYDIDGDGKVTIVDLVKAINALGNANSDTTPGISQDPYDGEACAKKR